jgi:hypothetical protein
MCRTPPPDALPTLIAASPSQSSPAPSENSNATHSARRTRIQLPSAISPVHPSLARRISAGAVLPPNDLLFQSAISPKIAFCYGQDLCPESDDAHQYQQEAVLIEILHSIQNRGGRCPSLSVLDDIVQMLRQTLYHPDPVFATAIETDFYAIDIVEPTWSILSLRYELLLHILEQFPDCASIDWSLISRFFFLTQVRDRREREYIQRILMLYFDIRLRDRSRFIRTMGNALALVSEKEYCPLAAAPLLGCANHLVSTWFEPFRPQLLDLFHQVVLPLFASDFLTLFSGQLGRLLVDGYLAQRPALSWSILEAVQRHWPRLSGGKPACFAELLLSIVLRISDADLASMHIHLFDFLANLVRSPSAAVVRVILSIFDRPAWGTVFETVGIGALRPLILAIDGVSKTHWAVDVRARGAAIVASVRRKSAAMEPEADGFETNLNEAKARARNRAWQDIAAAAGQSWEGGKSLVEGRPGSLDQAAISFLPEKCDRPAAVAAVPPGFRHSFSCEVVAGPFAMMKIAREPENLVPKSPSVGS